MAIIISYVGNKTVNTLADRNAIERRFDGMQITVLDAIADIKVGIGEAGYQWSEALQKWLLIWKTSKDELTFVQETKVILNGRVAADNYPQNSLVWNCSVRDSNNVIHLEIEPNVALNVIDIATFAFDGYDLHYTYAYGKAVASPTPIVCGTF